MTAAAQIGDAARLSFVLVLIGIIGAMQSFGYLGLFLGLMIMVSPLSIWREWIGGEDCLCSAHDGQRYSQVAPDSHVASFFRT
ncbi:MAG TPA: hypothetical protein VIQ05_18740 [Tardiphaga sp.]